MTTKKSSRDSPEKSSRVAAFPWPPASIHVMIKPRGAVCNLGCEYCFYLKKKELYAGSKFRMSDEVLESFTRQYIEMQQVPEVTFGWQGGEPLLMGLDFFKKAIEYQHKYKKPGMRIVNALQTNGTLLDDQWGKFLHDNDFLVGISIDGPPALHDIYRKTLKGAGSFKKTRQGVNVLRRSKVEHNVLACVNSTNADHPLEVYRYFKDVLKVNFIQFIPVVERVNETGFQEGTAVTARSVSGKQYGNFLIAIFDEWVRNDVGTMFVQAFDVALSSWVGQPGALCVFARTCGFALALEHTGDLYACDHYVEPAELRGNIMETPLPELVASKAQREFALKKWEALPKECLDCKWLVACHGGCPKNRVGVTRDGESGLNHLCEGYKAFFSHVDPYMRFMARELQQRRPPAGIMKAIKNGALKQVDEE